MPKPKFSGGADLGIDLAYSAIEMNSFIPASPVFYLIVSWKIYNTFLKDKLKCKYSDIQIENIDHQLVALRESRAYLGNERRKILKEIRQLDRNPVGETASLDYKSIQSKLQTQINDMVDVEYDIRYLCILRRFFVRMSKHDKERFAMFLEPMETNPTDPDLVKKLIQQQPGTFRKGDIEGMVDAYMKIEVESKDVKPKMIELLSRSEGLLDYEELVKGLTDRTTLREDVVTIGLNNTTSK